LYSMSPLTCQAMQDFDLQYDLQYDFGLQHDLGLMHDVA